MWNFRDINEYCKEFGKMKTEEMIKALEKKGYEIWESKKFLNVKLSDMKGVLLRAESGRILVETWNNWTKDILNDFEYKIGRASCRERV